MQKEERKEERKVLICVLSKTQEDTELGNRENIPRRGHLRAGEAAGRCTM